MNTIELAVNGQFTEFEGELTKQFKEKLAAHSDVASYTKEYDSIQELKGKFQEINNPEQ